MGTAVDLGIVALRGIVSPAQIRWGNLVLGIAVALLVLGFAVWPVFRPNKDAVIAGEVPFNFDEYPVFNESLQNFAIASVVDLPENAIVFTDWDLVWPYYYAAHILESRRDLTFIETYPADDVGGVADSVVEYAAIKLTDHPIFFSERERALLKAEFVFTPVRFGPAHLFRVKEGK